MIVANAPGCCRAIVGSTFLTPCGWLTAPPSLRVIGTAATAGFDVRFRIELVAPEPHEVRPCYRGATRMPSTVGTTSESESWLIADVPLDNGFRLELGAVATDRE